MTSWCCAILRQNQEQINIRYSRNSQLLAYIGSCCNSVRFSSGLFAVGKQHGIVYGALARINSCSRLSSHPELL